MPREPQLPQHLHQPLLASTSRTRSDTSARRMKSSRTCPCARGGGLRLQPQEGQRLRLEALRLRAVVRVHQPLEPPRQHHLLHAQGRRLARRPQARSNSTCLCAPAPLLPPPRSSSSSGASRPAPPSGGATRAAREPPTRAPGAPARSAAGAPACAPAAPRARAPRPRRGRSGPAAAGSGAPPAAAGPRRGVVQQQQQIQPPRKGRPVRGRPHAQLAHKGGPLQAPGGSAPTVRHPVEVAPPQGPEPPLLQGCGERVDVVGQQLPASQRAAGTPPSTCTSPRRAAAPGSRHATGSERRCTTPTSSAPVQHRGPHTHSTCAGGQGHARTREASDKIGFATREAPRPANPAKEAPCLRGTLRMHGTQAFFDTAGFRGGPCLPCKAFPRHATRGGRRGASSLCC